MDRIGLTVGTLCTRGAWPLMILMIVLGWSPQAWADYCGSGRPVALAGVNWESGEFITAVTREVLERGFGCRTETIPGNSVTLEQAVANDDVQILNTYRRTVFGRFFASLAGVNEAQYYEAPQAEKEVPKVKF